MQNLKKENDLAIKPSSKRNPWKEMAKKSKKLVRFYEKKFNKPINEIIKDYPITAWCQSKNIHITYKGAMVKYSYRWPDFDENHPCRNIHNSWGHFMVYKNTDYHCELAIVEKLENNELKKGAKYDIGCNKIIKIHDFFIMSNIKENL